MGGPKGWVKLTTKVEEAAPAPAGQAEEGGTTAVVLVVVAVAPEDGGDAVGVRRRVVVVSAGRPRARARLVMAVFVVLRAVVRGMARDGRGGIVEESHLLSSYLGDEALSMI